MVLGRLERMIGFWEDPAEGGIFWQVQLRGVHLVGWEGKEFCDKG